MKVLIKESNALISSSGLPLTHREPELITAVNRFSALMSKLGFKIETKDSPQARELFRQYPLQKQVMLVQHFNGYIALIEQIVAQRVYPRANRQFIWSALAILGLRPLHDVFDKIEDDDVVEIYDRDHIQIFRNLLFFELCSYSVYDILVFDWPSLYDRDEMITKKIMLYGNDSLTIGRETSAFPDVPDHILKERFSDEKRSFKIKMKFHSPLFDRQRIETAPKAVLSCLKATLVSHE